MEIHDFGLKGANLKILKKTTGNVIKSRKALFAHSVCANLGLNVHSVCANLGLNARSPDYYVAFVNMGKVCTYSLSVLKRTYCQ